MDIEQLIHTWFSCWESGQLKELPLSHDFTHTSPYGTIHGKKAYMDLVSENLDKFLSYSFKIHDIIKQSDKACIRYTACRDEFSMEVSEWHYCENGLIKRIIAYYNIEGEISAERQISYPET